jgi:hypothetical protein
LIVKAAIAATLQLCLEYPQFAREECGMSHLAAGAGAMSMMVEGAGRATANRRSPRVERLLRALLLALLGVAFAAVVAAPLRAEPKPLKPIWRVIKIADVPATITGAWSLDKTGSGTSVDLTASFAWRLGELQDRFSNILLAVTAYQDPCTSKTRTTFIRLDRMKSAPARLDNMGRFSLTGEVESWSCVNSVPTTKVEWETRTIGGQSIEVPVVKTLPTQVRTRSHPASFVAKFILAASAARDGDVAVQVKVDGEPAAFQDKAVAEGLLQFTTELGSALTAALGARRAFPQGLEAFAPRLTKVDFAADRNALVIQYTFVATAAAAQQVNDFISQSR